MDYESAHTGPKIDAAVEMLGKVQEARDSTSSDLAEVKVLASQVDDSATQVATKTELVSAKTEQVLTGAAEADQARVEAVQASTVTVAAKEEAVLSAQLAQASEFAASQSQVAAGLSEQITVEKAAIVQELAQQLEGVAGGVQKKNVRPQYVPVFFDEENNVPAWFSDGAFEVVEIGPSTTLLVSTIAGTESFKSSAKFVPVFIDEKRNVGVWLEDGKLAALGLSDSLKATLGLDRKYAPANQPAASALPVATDGRSLWAWRSRLAKIKAGAGQARLLITGDSWTEYLAIPQQLAALLHALFGKAGYGWISVNGIYMFDGATLLRNGWTLYDASTGAVPSYGTGIDGMYVSAATATATLTVGNVRATNIDIYYRRHGGTFRWRIDGGIWNVVAADASGSLGKVSVSGLADAVHSLEIDTTGNTGTVVLNGFRAFTPAAVGVELLKAGNAGLDGEQLARFSANISPIAVDFAPDVVVVILGSNDYRRSSSTVEKYIESLTALVSQYRAASPDCAFVFIAPADSNGVAVRPLIDYRDALYGFCIANGHEFYNMHDEWGPFAKMNALGMWVDTLHLNDSGAYALASRLLSKILL
ncbi:GDSL-type esterase/lipase family protein [Pseudomonas ovata]|uniref:GDSL-type esterase/lipase family protein n=1 Tax=Pseudomonas ovata TaxID=1839709 RepID=UPI000D692A63|nr:GDSL-type esterase/lipase family protein [Pseudomonas ovata]